MGFSVAEAMPAVIKPANKKEIKQKLPLIQRLILKNTQRKIKKASKKATDGYCDIIQLKRGESIYIVEAKIRKVDKYNVTYVLCSYQDGPDITISLSTVCKIEYGDKDNTIVYYDGCKEPEEEVDVAPPRPSIPSSPKLDVLAVAALISAFIFPPLAFFLSIFSISKINSSRRWRGKGIAVFALIISLVAMGAIGVFLYLG